MEILCASCGEQVETTDGDGPCPLCGGATLLDRRYRLEAIIGRGASGTTYRASRAADGAPVAIKELLVRKLDSLDTQERFEREGNTLAELDHPQIPGFVDQFLAGEGRLLGWYMVSELIEGRTLAEERANKRYDAEEVLDVIEELAGVLAYLHERQPPVIHRDVKPSNVIRRADDGRLVLIDFGAVKDAAAALAGDAPSVAGTFGFMAPEQLAGDPQLASDLYGLGATAVALLSGRSPGDLLDTHHRIQWEPVVAAPTALRELLGELLDADPARRPAARDLVRRLPGIRRRLRTPDAPPPIVRPGDDPAEAARDAEVAIADDRLTLVLGVVGAGLLVLFDIGGAVFGGLPTLATWVLSGAGWLGLIVGALRLRDDDATALVFIASLVGLAGLLFAGLTHDVDSEVVYFADALLLLGYGSLLTWVGWSMRDRGALGWQLAAAAAVSLTIAAPHLVATFDKSLFGSGLSEVLWSVGTYARGYAHLMLLLLIASSKGEAPTA